MPVTVSRLVVHSFRENRYCFGCSKPTVGVDASSNRSSKVLKTLSGLNFSVNPKRRRSCGVFGMPPSPSLDMDVPHAGAARRAAG
jgi:hypothetical protein